MSSFYPLSNQIGSLPASAIQTFTHGFHSAFSRFRERKAVAIPTKFFISNPPLLSAGRRNPNSSFALGVINGEGPLSIKAENITVWNQLRFQWINNFHNVISQNKFRFYPTKVNSSPENQTNNHFKKYLRGAGAYPETVSRKESYQNKRTTGPSEIATGSEGFIHNLSIAGDGK